MRTLPLAAALGLGLLATGAHAAPRTVLPGYWESTESYSVLLGGTSTARKCLTAAQVEEFLNAPGTSHYRCTYASQEIAGGRARFRGGSCSNRKGRKVLSDVDIDGTYAPERFHLDFRFGLTLSAGVALPGTATLDAHRIAAECPAADASPEK